MTAQSWGHTIKGLSAALVVALAITVYALPDLAQGAPSATSDIVLAGFTSQRLPAFFKVSGDGRVLMRSGIAIRMGCTSGAQPVWPDAFAHIPIAADGRLHTSFIPPTTTQNGVTSSGTDTLTARLNPAHSKLTGTWRLKVAVSMANGQSVSCDSGPVHFSATS